MDGCRRSSNYANPQLRTYMITMLKYWISACDVDGFRCDVAYMVPTDFWDQVRSELTKIKPDIMMLAEGSKPELLLNAFDIDYSWPLLGTVNDVMERGAPASNLRASWERRACDNFQPIPCTCAFLTTTTRPAPFPVMVSAAHWRRRR